jgi:DNA-binding GntR family transcriptional regulator
VQPKADHSLWGLTIDRKSTVDQVVSLIRDKILRGELRPGTVLQEATLAGRIGVSRNTLREAMRVLVHEGLVCHTIRRGGIVTSLTTDDVRDIYGVRRMFELEAVNATGAHGPDDLAALDIVDGLRRAVQAADWAAAVDWDMEFHRRLIGFLGSRRLDHFYARLLAELKLGLVLLDRRASDHQSLVSDHQSLLDLLMAGRRDECKTALRAHLEVAERNLIAVIEATEPSVAAT